MKGNIVSSWSGGKDSCYALMQAIKMGYDAKVLLNVLNEQGRISRSHGIPYSILQAQARATALPMLCIQSSWEEYEKKFTEALNQLKEEYNLEAAVFGDIDLQAHRDWEEKVCSKANLKAVLPLWQMDRKKLVLEMLDQGIETMIVSCNETMGERFIGQMLTPILIDELESMGIDPCGENGEYHTLVVDCPLFIKRLNINLHSKVNHGNYWFSQLEL
jgi:uncharacterized protein (TIGR00290 family)